MIDRRGLQPTDVYAITKIESRECHPPDVLLASQAVHLVRTPLAPPVILIFSFQDKLERINSGNNLDGSSPRKVLIEQLQRLLPADDSLPDQVRSGALVTDSSVHHLYFSPSLLYSTLTGSGYSHLLAQYHQRASTTVPKLRLILKSKYL